MLMETKATDTECDECKNTDGHTERKRETYRQSVFYDFGFESL